MSEGPLLSVRDLSVGVPIQGEKVDVVSGVSFDLALGESLGIVGESGSGKSVTALAIAGLLPPGAVRGRIEFDGRDLLGLDEGALRRIRGAEIGMIFQDPMSSLNPTRSVGKQIGDVLRAHRPTSRAAMRRRAAELLDMVGIPDATRRIDSLPHEFSGGMRQRVMIAMALSCKPKLLIADEPTTALDVTTQAQILQLLRRLQGELGMATILISHDFGVIERNVDRVAVMYAGQLVETGPVARVIHEPRHPYAWGLSQAVQQMRAERGARLLSIPGSPPAPSNRFTGCRFAERCPFVMPQCTESVPERELPDGHYLCWLDEPPAALSPPVLRDTAVTHEPRVAGEVLVRVDDLTVSYGGRIGGRRKVKPAVAGVSLELREGETLGLVGESGSGKSTTGRALLRLVPLTGGTVDYLGNDVKRMSSSAFRSYARDVKIVFQDPVASLDPRMTVRALVEEPLRVHGAGGDAAARTAEIVRVLALVGLGEHLVDRYPHELSGGQRQRVSLARSLVLSPRVLILDEPVSALDVSVQAQVINLLVELRSKLSLTYLFVSHDLNVVRYLADRVAVMYRGEIVEQGPTDEIYRDPRHPYTQSLLLAAQGRTVDEAASENGLTVV